MDCEAEDDPRLSARRPDSSGLPIDQGQLRSSGSSRERLGDGLGAAYQIRRAHPHGIGVCGQHDVRIEQRKQCSEISIAGRGQESLDDSPGTAAIVGSDSDSLDAAASAARQLSRRSW
jgi:hypothetical protein